jgi:hypothetical protein
MIELLRDPRACQEMGEKGHVKYEREHTWDAVAARMCEAIGATLN